MALNIVTASGTGAQRGAEIGEQLSELLEVTWKRWVFHFSKNDVDAEDLALRLSEVGGWETAERYCPDLLAELEAMAQAANMPWYQVAALSMLDESWALTGGMGCTAVAITRSDSRAAGQNMDLPDWTNGLQTVLNVRDESGLGVIAATYPGSLATMGMNSNGVIVVVNALDLATNMTGMPVDFVTRGALHQRTAADAISYIREIPHAVGQNYTVLDAQDLFMVEAAADQVLDVTTHPEVSVHTNHAFTREYFGSEGSYARMKAIEDSRDDLRSAKDIKSALLDKESGVCITLGRWREDMYSFMGLVGDSNSKQAWVNDSPAYGGEFHEVSFI
jgi:isopenicillin-N N-acyltransferase-like protein